MKIIDSHTHIATRPGFGLTTGTLKDAGESLILEMKKSGVSHAIVIGSPMQDCWCEGESSTNEILLDFAKIYPQISVVAAVDMTENKKVDLGFLEDGLKNKKIVGVKFYTGYQSFYPNNSRCKPVYELCEKYDAPVMFHSGDTLASKGYIKYSHPIHTDDVAIDFPNLKIIIAHLGNPWMRDTAELLYRHENVYADISGLFIKEDIENKDKVKLATAWIKEAITYSSPKKLIYGTDYPLVEMLPYIKFAKQLGIKGANLEDLMWKNAARLFKLGL